MKYIIKENQNTKIKSFISEKIKEWGLRQTLSTLGFSFEQFVDIFKNELPKLSCQDLEQLLFFVYGYDPITKIIRVKGDEFKIFVNLYDASFVVRNITKKTTLDGLMAPYFENCGLSLEFKYYSEPYYEEIELGYEYEYIIDLKTKFKNVQEFKYYIEHDLLKFVIYKSYNVMDELYKK